jgi:hypothetical protein
MEGLYAARHGAIAETNRHTRSDPQIAAALFGHTPEVESERYVHGIPEETRRAALLLDGALSGE